ncbi:hypothetical protein GF312_03850 [Candidatus Poribacteria bacterium]|nr:hypothetical protein [Candidatus Poribacteria bacterium]
MIHNRFGVNLNRRPKNEFNAYKELFNSSRVLRFLTFFSLVVFCALLWAGCGEKENENLANARTLIQQGKYKESQDVSQLKNELNLALQVESGNPEALCPLKALEIISSSADSSSRQKAISDIISMVNSIEEQIKELEAIDEDLRTDDDEDNLVKLERKWISSIEPATMILVSDSSWISSSGKTAVDLLVECLKVHNTEIRGKVVDLLVSFKDITFEGLIAALQNENRIVRRQAVIALGKIGDDRAIDPVVELLTDEDPGVKFYIPVALRMIGGDKMVEALHKAMKNEMAQVRIAAADILGAIEDDTGIDLLIELLADNNSYVKTSANNALIKIGKPVVPKLIEVLNTEAEGIQLPSTDFIGDKIGDEYVKELSKRTALQVSAASILGTIGDPDAIPSLIVAMQRETTFDATETEKANAASVRSGASSALVDIGPAAVEPLIDVLKNSRNNNAVENAASILGSIGDDRAVEPLIAALKDERKSLRSMAADSLGTLKDRRAVPQLIEALKDEDAVTRANAAASLGTINDKRATKPLMSIVMDKKEREKIRDSAITSLGTLKDTEALGLLVKILIDEYEKDGIRKTAATALRTMENSWPSEALVGLLKGEIVTGILMPEKGTVTKWNEEEGSDDLVSNVTVLAETSTGQQVKAPSKGELVKIYVKAGEEAEANELIGLVSYEDREIEQEERSSIRSAAALALGKVKGENALSALMRAVRKDKSAAVRKNAATALYELDNADARSALVKTLKDDDSGIVRSEAASALGRGTLKSTDSVDVLIDTMRNDKYESARVMATWSLGEIANKNAVDDLIDVIVEGKDDEPEADAVVNQAITALDKIAGPAVQPLIDVLNNPEIDAVPKGKVAKTLGLIASADATEALNSALEDESVVVRSEAAKSLGLITDRRAVDNLVELLGNEDEWVTVRANAAEALGKIKDERGIMPLIQSLDSGIQSIRNNAVVALGLIKDKRASASLAEIVGSDTEDDSLRVNAISSLASIGYDGVAVADVLTGALEDDLTIRQNAITALGTIKANSAVLKLMGILGDMKEPNTIRANAAKALGEIGDSRASSLLIQRLSDENESDAVWIQVGHAVGKLDISSVPDIVKERVNDTWYSASIRSAGMMALSGTDEIPLLIEMLDNATVAIRQGAALALGESGRKEVIQPLIDKLKNDAEEVVRRDSATALGVIADPSAEQALIDGLSDATDSVKIQSAIGLGKINRLAGIAALIETVQDTGKANSVRYTAARALGDAGSQKAVPALRDTLENTQGNMHYEAAIALQKITGEDLGYEI